MYVIPLPPYSYEFSFYKTAFSQQNSPSLESIREESIREKYAFINFFAPLYPTTTQLCPSSPH